MGLDSGWGCLQLFMYMHSRIRETCFLFTTLPRGIPYELEYMTASWLGIKHNNNGQPTTQLFFRYSVICPLRSWPSSCQIYKTMVHCQIILKRASHMKNWKIFASILISLTRLRTLTSIIPNRYQWRSHCSDYTILYILYREIQQ